VFGQAFIGKPKQFQEYVVDKFSLCAWIYAGTVDNTTSFELLINLTGIYCHEN
jgi:hypothetical protein